MEFKSKSIQSKYFKSYLFICDSFCTFILSSKREQREAMKSLKQVLFEKYGTKTNTSFENQSKQGIFHLLAYGRVYVCYNRFDCQRWTEYHKDQWIIQPRESKEHVKTFRIYLSLSDPSDLLWIVRSRSIKH